MVALNRSPATPTADEFIEASSAVRDFINNSENTPSYIDCMKVASKYVNTMHTKTRMALRQLLIEKYKILPPALKVRLVDSQLDKDMLEEPGPTAISIAKLNYKFCAWPVGLPSQGLCCGKPVNQNANSTITSKRYCEEHRLAAIDSKASARPASPMVMTRARAFNYAVRNRVSQAFSWRA